MQQEKSELEKTYRGKMDVYQMEHYIEEGETRQRKRLLYREIPCALSRAGSSQRGISSLRVVQKEAAPITEYVEKIFCSPEFFIPAGCRILVTQEGRRREFKQSGEAVCYEDHQEILVQRKSFA